MTHTTAAPPTHREAKNEAEGLYAGHAYSVLQTGRIGSGKNVQYRLVQLRNPHGCFEWKGAWSDDSELWDKHPKVKKKLLLPSGKASIVSCWAA